MTWRAISAGLYGEEEVVRTEDIPAQVKQSGGGGGGSGGGGGGGGLTTIVVAVVAAGAGGAVGAQWRAVAGRLRGRLAGAGFSTKRPVDRAV